MGLVRPAAPLLLLAVFGMALSGCASHGVDKAAYLQANRHVLRAVPRLPGSRLVNSYAIGDQHGNGWSDGGPFTAYDSHFDYTTPPGWSETRVLRFYERNLRGAGWTLVNSWSNERTFLKEPATVLITAAGRLITLSINHDRHADGTR
jgi:hypothetical protein